LPNVTMDFKQTFMEIKPTPVVAYYASRGPSNGFPGILKPDIMACTWVIGLRNLYSNYIIGSRTSYACAHATGVVILLKAAYPKYSGRKCH